MAPMPPLDEVSGKVELLPSSAPNSRPHDVEQKRSKWNYLAFAILSSLALVHVVNRAGLLPDTLPTTFGSLMTEASGSELCPQEGALYPHKEYALFQKLTGTYGTEKFKARSIDWVSSLRSGHHFTIPVSVTERQGCCRLRELFRLSESFSPGETRSMNAESWK